VKNVKPTLNTDARLAAVLNSIGDVYYVVDRNYRLTMFNDAALAFFGHPREEVEGAVLWELFPQFVDSEFSKLVRRAMEEGVPGRITARSRIRPDRVVDFRTAALGDGAVGVSLVDVTERVSAEQAMQESRERLDLAVGAHSIGIFDWHLPSGRILWSPKLEEIYGLDPRTFEGTAEAFQSRVLPEDFHRAQAETEAALAVGQDLIHFDFRIRRADGAVRWIEGAARVVYGADGAPERFVGTNVDVTERVEAQEAIRLGRERLDLAVGAHAIGIFDWDLGSGDTTWTGEMEEIFGLERGTFEGHTEHFRRRVLPEDLPRIDAETAAAIAAGPDRLFYAFRIIRDDGAVRWIEGASRLIRDAEGRAVRIVGTNVDVTERKLAEEHQRLLVNELNHRVKNTLAIVQAIAWQSFRTGGMALSARESFEGRIAALAAAHDVLTQANWAEGSIAQMVAGAVAPHDPGDGRVTARGPDVNLEPKTAVALAMAMHELATNAVKHGALSMPTGRVDVSWSAEAKRLRLTWRESGGPPLEGPVQRGFGARLLERGLAEELHGDVCLEFLPTGVLCTVDAPLDA
jgi:PAS domain S-box-containing protein